MLKRTFPDHRLRVRAAPIVLLATALIGVVGCSTTSRSRIREADRVAARPASGTGQGQPIALADLPPLPPAIEPPGGALVPTGAKIDRGLVRASLPADEPGNAAPAPTAAPAQAMAPEPREAIALEIGDLPPPPPLVPIPPAAFDGAPIPPAAFDGAPIPPAAFDGAVSRARCATCGGAGRLADLGSCTTCGGSGQCVPGRKPCHDFPSHTFVGRFFGELYHCLCCPDPCYEPTWVPEANSAFFMDFARPQTMTRLRVDDGMNMQFPDRSEFFWARAGLTRKNQFMGTGPKPPNFKLRNGHPIRGFFDVDWDQISLYQEAAANRASFFIEMPYRSIRTGLGQHFAGFSDMNLGTKSLLLDCELLQVTFQFRTYIPIGVTTKGLGTGHVSLEPSLLFALHLAKQTYVQAEVTEWIPIGGDPTYAGAVFMHHASLNQVLWRITPDVPLIAMLEYSGWTFQDGAYTDPVRGPMHSAGETYVTVGPGLRLSVCKRADFGTAIAYPVSDHHWADPQVRTEFRLLY